MPIAASDAIALDSLGKIRRRHVELMRETLASEATLKLAPTIVDFMRQVANAGAKLEAEDERAAAQNVLDYWNASLLTSGARKTISDAPTDLAQFVPSENHGLPSGENPFQDIGALGLDDRALLFGRGDAIATVVELVRKHPIVFIAGSVGSGRTSLAMAGVAPKFESSANESRKILALSSLGTDPLRALGGILPKDQRLSAEELRNSPERLRNAVDEACPGQGALIVVDNVEELFTRCADQVKRDKFAEAIASLAGKPHRHNAILIVLDECAEQLFELAALKPYATTDARFSPTPPTAAQIQRVLSDYAASAGLRLDPECVEELAQDLQGDPAALALARFMLLHLWPLSKGGFAGLEAYKVLGCPNDALARVAAQTYEGLSPEGKIAAKRLFLTLVKPDVRRGAFSQPESRRVLDRQGSDAGMSEALEAFCDSGLLRERSPGDNTDDSLEIVHDRLLFQWKLLVEWLKEKKQSSERRFQLWETAELWDKSKRSQGYLFNDKDLINDALRYIDDSPQSKVLGEFLDASEQALKIAQRNRTILFRSIFAGLALFTVIVSGLLYIIYLYHNNEQAFIDARIRKLLELMSSRKYAARELDENQVKELNTIESEMFNSLWIYEHFGSAKIDLKDLTFPRLNLRNLSFDNLRFIRSNISRLDFGNDNKFDSYVSPYVFNDSHITESTFDGANLSYSQFRDTLIVNTSFADANLDRAAFDGAQLCKVDFTDASLLLASFWNSTLDMNTQESLKHVAWWLAKGWTPAQINDLADKGASEQDAKFRKFQEKREQDLNRLLKSKDASNAKGIPADIVEAYNNLIEADATNPDFRSVQALNRWAWALTINGLNLVPENWREARIGDVCSHEAVPATAQDAAKQALCFVKELSAGDASAENYSGLRSSIEDTLGYILLQEHDVNNALSHLRIGANPKSRETRDALFRLAVAEYASDDPADRQASHKDMQTSIDFGYVPTHEILLAEYIERKYKDAPGQPTEDDFRTHLDFALQDTNKARNAPQEKCPG
jgi:uncharacterized protein YjbI with pentapeptide repeats